MRRMYRTLIVAGLAALAVFGLWVVGAGAMPTSAATPNPSPSPSSQSWVDSSINHPTPGPTSP